MNNLKVARLQPDAKLPTRKHPSDAGMDFYCLEEERIQPNSFTLVHTGVTVEIPEGYVGVLKPKGASTHLTGSGVIDAGYQGEIIFRVVNPYHYAIPMAKHAPVGQMILLPVLTPSLEEVSPEEIHAVASSRGAEGGIHTNPQAQ